MSRRERPRRSHGHRDSAPSRRAERQPGRSGPGGEWLYGIHPVLAALGNPARRCRTLLATAQGAALLPPALPVKPEIVPVEALTARLPAGAVHQGLALLAEPLAAPTLSEVAQPGPDGRALIVLLDQVTDPHNVGAILRSACAFGAQALVLTDRHAPQAMGTLAKSASGALEHVPLVRVVNLARSLDALAEAGYHIIGLDERGEMALPNILRPPLVALVLGAEGTGLRRLTRERCQTLARLPTLGPIASLNVSNAAAVALYVLR